MGQVVSRFAVGAAVVVGVAAAAAAASAMGQPAQPARRAPHRWDYARIKALIAQHRLALPCMLVDVDAVHRNAARFAAAARRHGKTVRLATKSVRVPQLIFDVLLRHGDTFRGLMCFSVPEAHALQQYAREHLAATDYARLRGSGALHTLVAYPTVQESDLALAWRMVVREGHALALTVDSVAHVELLDAFWAARRQQEETAGGGGGGIGGVDTGSGGGGSGLGGGSGERDGVRAADSPGATAAAGVGSTNLPAGWQRPAGSQRLAVSVDADMSFRPLGGAVHLGVRRSPCHTPADVARVVAAVEVAPCLRLGGVMGYEAQVAGLCDRSPFAALLFNPVARLLKALSLPDVFRRRGAISRMLAQRGYAAATTTNTVVVAAAAAATADSTSSGRTAGSSSGGGGGRAASPRAHTVLDASSSPPSSSPRLDEFFFNGGGSGDAARCAADPAVTEVAVGSGLLQSALFDWYADCAAEPAMCFAVRITREPDAAGHVVTCQSGGFAASGDPGADKAPQPFLPPGLQPLAGEGWGEVQTPLRATTAAARALRVGDPVLARPAKAGEVAERFNSYVLIGTGGASGDSAGHGGDESARTVVLGEARTYRGLGYAFY